MSNPVNRIPDPLLPEHELLRSSGILPQISSSLRNRVLIDVRRQVRNGRWADRIRITAAVLAASLLVCLVWRFRWASPERLAEQTPGAMQTEGPATSSGSSLGEQTAHQRSRDFEKSNPSPSPVVPQGGPSSRPETKELQQLNRLIEDMQGRNRLCGVFPIW